MGALCKKGSITIEAAIILPLFIFGMSTLLSIGVEMSFFIKLKEAMYIEARKLSIECCDGRNIAKSQVKYEIDKILDDLDVNYSFVEKGKEGITYDDSYIDDNEYVNLKANYSFVPGGASIFGIVKIPIEETVVCHVWCGYNKSFFGAVEGEYVYITTNSEVYHRDRECSHIRLSIIDISGEDVTKLRNDEGNKYYSCSICKSKKNDFPLYITSEGNRYHNNITCSGLKRTVRAIRIENVAGKRPCQRCGN